MKRVIRFFAVLSMLLLLVGCTKSSVTIDSFVEGLEKFAKTHDAAFEIAEDNSVHIYNIDGKRTALFYFCEVDGDILWIKIDSNYEFFGELLNCIGIRVSDSTIAILRAKECEETESGWIFNRESDGSVFILNKALHEATRNKD